MFGRSPARAVVAMVVALMVAAGVWAVVPAGAAEAGADPVVAEAEFVARINELRTARGLAPLTVHAELTHAARRWAERMAAEDRIFHNPDLAGSVAAPWLKLGENVGVGMTVQKLHDAFVASPTHYRNLVDVDFGHIGVGVVVGRDGALFTAHEFMQLDAPLSRPAAAPASPGSRPQTAAAPVVAAAHGPDAASPPPARVVLVLQGLRELD